MANVLIIQLFMNLFYKSESDFKEVQRDIEVCKKEFSANYRDENTKVVTIIYEANFPDNTKAIVKILELKDTGQGAEYMPVEGFDPLKLADPNNPETLQYIFDILHCKFNPSIKILSTYDHGYGFIMSRQPVPADRLQFILSNKDLLDFLDRISLSDDKDRDEEFLSKRNKILDELNEFLLKEEGELNIKMNFSKFFTTNKLITPSKAEAYRLSHPLRDEELTVNMNGITALTIIELRTAIEKSAFKKFDAVIMLNCFMQTVDTAYALKGYCDYLMAAETGHWFAGYNYAELMNITTVDDAFFERLKNATLSKLGAIGQNMVDDLSFCCLRLSESENFFEALKKLLAAIMKAYNEQKVGLNLYKAAGMCKDVTSSAFIDKKDSVSLVDLFCLLSNFNDIQADPEISSLTKDAEIKFRNILACEHTGKDYRDTPHPTASGLSIYFPTHDAGTKASRKDLVRPYYFLFIFKDAKIPSPFAMENQWGRFLSTYYTYVVNHV